MICAVRLAFQSGMTRMKHSTASSVVEASVIVASRAGPETVAVVLGLHFDAVTV